MIYFELIFVQFLRFRLKFIGNYFLLIYSWISKGWEILCYGWKCGSAIEYLPNTYKALGQHLALPKSFPINQLYLYTSASQLLLCPTVLCVCASSNLTSPSYKMLQTRSVLEFRVF